MQRDRFFMDFSLLCAMASCLLGCATRSPPLVDPQIRESVRILTQWNGNDELLDLRVLRDPDGISLTPEGARDVFRSSALLKLDVHAIALELIDLATLADTLSDSAPSDVDDTFPLRWGIILHELSSSESGEDGERKFELLMDSQYRRGWLNGQRVILPHRSMRRWMERNLSWRFPEFISGFEGRKAQGRGSMERKTPAFELESQGGAGNGMGHGAGGSPISPFEGG